MAKRYRVKAGKHHEGDRIYKTGEVLESDKPLAKLFPNKFDIVTEDVEVNEGISSQDYVRPSIIPDADDNKHGMDYKPPDVVAPQPRAAKDNVRPETDPENPKSQRAPARLASEEDEEEGESKEAKSSALGAEVTDQYPQAQEKGLRVFRKVSKYNVSTVKDPETAVNDKYLKRVEVDSYLDEYEV